jgi:N-acetylglucosamine-6-sulfatase
MAASGAAALGMAAGRPASAQPPAHAAAAAHAGAKGRNIVFVLLDDLRYDGFGLENPFFQTPAIDALAKGGVVFERAFVTTSLCSPSRACSLSGQYAHRHGVLDNNTALPLDTPTFPLELQKAGYRTGYIGKWHMGGDSDEPRPGFDRWVSFRGQGIYLNPTFNIDGEQVKREGHVTDLITDYAEEFIRQEDARPFCVYVGHKAVHAMFEPAERHKGSYADKTWPRPASMADTEENYRGKPAWVRAQRDSWHGVDGMYDGQCGFDKFTRDYAETLRGVDDGVARLVEVLREKGLLESTLFVFTSDNGFQFGEHGFIDKRCMYEASIRVPLIVHCPELCEGGQRRREMVLNIDHAPTLL